MLKKRADTNLKNSIIFTLFFLSLATGLYFFRIFYYSKDYILERANYYFFDEKYFFAVRYFDKAIKLKTLDIEVYKDYAQSLLKLENYDLAIKYFKLVVELDPFDFENYYALANILYTKACNTNNRKLFLQACQYLKEAINLNPNSEKLYLLIGLCYRRCSLYNEVRLFYNKALVSQKFNKASFYNLIGNTFRQEGLNQNALDYYQKAKESDPLFFIAYYNIGDIYFHLRDFAQALSWYKKSIEVNKEFIAGYLKIAGIYYQDNRFESSKDWALEALKINPNNPKVNYILGMSLYYLNEKEKGLKYLKYAANYGDSEAMLSLKTINLE
ncbi:MAG: tetratricopeptide repeat protein [Endomicrobium sp.]|jgi:tetratricopeptide (TPR) repeat protein|nr:tetratricopeptide repeat protein [Endomicrobium sp.]